MCAVIYGVGRGYRSHERGLVYGSHRGELLLWWGKSHGPSECRSTISTFDSFILNAHVTFQNWRRGQCFVYKKCFVFMLCFVLSTTVNC